MEEQEKSKFHKFVLNFRNKWVAVPVIGAMLYPIYVVLKTLLCMFTGICIPF